MTKQEESTASAEEERYFDSVTKRARLLYGLLPSVGFSQVTFRELGEASAKGTPFDRLSGPLRATLIRMVAMFEEGAKNLDVEEAVTEATASPEETAPESPATEEDGGKDDGDDEEDDESEEEEETPPSAPAETPPKPEATT